MARSKAVRSAPVSGVGRPRRFVRETLESIETGGFGRCRLCGAVLPVADLAFSLEHRLACLRCLLKLEEEADARRWEQIAVAPPKAVETIADGPYAGFRMQTGDGKPDPERARKCLEEAERWRREQEEWRQRVKKRKE